MHQLVECEVNEKHLLFQSVDLFSSTFGSPNIEAHCSAVQAVYQMPIKEDEQAENSIPLALQSLFFKVSPHIWTANSKSCCSTPSLPTLFLLLCFANLTFLESNTGLRPPRGEGGVGGGELNYRMLGQGTLPNLRVLVCSSALHVDHILSVFPQLPIVHNNCLIAIGLI